MTDLILPLKAEYFHAIKSGEKTEEYRLCNDYWRKRLEGRSYDRIILTLGYPKRDDHERRIIRPWLGFVVKTITHPHFGSEPVQVYAIDVRGTMKTLPLDYSRCSGRFNLGPNTEWCPERDTCQRHLAFLKWDREAGVPDYKGISVTMARPGCTDKIEVNNNG